MKEKIICVTNRHLCKGDFQERIRKIAHAGAGLKNIEFGGIMLREKDLEYEDYASLAEETGKICRSEGVPFIAHSFLGIEMADALHMPLGLLAGQGADFDGRSIKVIGASCHSVNDAQLAEKEGCAYITYGHVFETDCKRGLAPRGIERLKELISSVSIPVYAIGGISPANHLEAVRAGAAGVCVMSGLMQCDDPEEYFGSFDASFCPSLI